MENKKVLYMSCDCGYTWTIVTERSLEEILNEIQIIGCNVCKNLENKIYLDHVSSNEIDVLGAELVKEGFGCEVRF